MKKLIACINMSLDGYCDHTSMTADEELHNHYTALLNEGGTILYGRITYQLMEDFWPSLVKNPSGDKSLDDFAAAIDGIHKIVFSHTLKDVSWKSATLAKGDIREEVLALKQSNKDSKDILVGSPSLIVALTKLNLFDEYQLCVHPVIVGSGLPLFKNITDKCILKLTKSKAFESGAIVLYYKPIKNN